MDQAKERVAHALGKHSKLDCVQSTRLTEREQERRMALENGQTNMLNNVNLAKRKFQFLERNRLSFRALQKSVAPYSSKLYK